MQYLNVEILNVGLKYFLKFNSLLLELMLVIVRS